MSNALYVHIPFCQTICAYCDFCRVGYNSNLVDRYLAELENETQFLTSNIFRTIYIGGGTPTSLNEVQLDRLLIMLNKYSTNTVEYTIEVNPETLTEKKVLLLKKYGINRVSIGVQTFNERLLKIIKRRHTLEDIEYCINLLRNNGINNISIDLMYGLPTQTNEEFMDSIKKAVKLEIPHISLYGLTIEEHSEFKRNNIETLDSEESDQMYFDAIDYLKQFKYEQYEISNFCKAGFKSNHNLVYWHYEDFDAIGLGASGKINHQRFTNTRNFIKYFNHEYREEVINLTVEDEMFETIMMGLRLKNGVEISDEIFQYFKEEIKQKEREKLLEFSKHYLKCTEKGYYILNDILVDFLK